MALEVGVYALLLMVLISCGAPMKKNLLYLNLRPNAQIQDRYELELQNSQSRALLRTVLRWR